MYNQIIKSQVLNNFLWIPYVLRFDVIKLFVRSYYDYDSRMFRWMDG